MNQLLVPKKPDDQWLQSFLEPSLWQAKAYAIDMPKVKTKLDQNECPWDFPPALKEKILTKVRERSWNRYPNPLAEELTAVLSEHLGVPAGCLLTGPGSNHLITITLDVLARRLKGKMVVARPSFALFEMHCRYAGIPYEVWEQDENFNYDLRRLPDLPDGSLVIFASPNNPTGTYLPYSEFAKLLTDHPRSFFIADEAYYEFADEPYTQLLAKHANFLLIRTMSKNMGAAGVRCGYLMGAENTVSQIKKMRLPYLLNHFTVEAAKTMLSDPEARGFIARNIQNARSERQRVFNSLQLLQGPGGFSVIPSQANFVLLRWADPLQAGNCYRRLIEEGILVRDVSAGPGLAGCLRVSIGDKAENDLFITALNKIYS